MKKLPIKIQQTDKSNQKSKSTNSRRVDSILLQFKQRFWLSFLYKPKIQLQIRLWS